MSGGAGAPLYLAPRTDDGRARLRRTGTGAEADVAARDRQDETRAEAPLTVPPGAVVIDTTDMTVDEVIARCLAVIKGQG